MQIAQKSVCIIDYEAQEVFQREAPETFEAFISELINHISNNSSVREYKTQSNSTEVIAIALSLCSTPTNVKLAIEKMTRLANRLLSKEVVAQDSIAHMNVNVQKGSLIQALLFDDKSNKYTYLLAKVEHTEFVDDTDFAMKTGFSTDKKTIWKTCLIDFPNLESEEYQARMYSPNKIAKYWYDDFLEMTEIANDETNTKTAFKAIEITLGQNLKDRGKDHTIIRNSFIGYFKNNEHIDFPKMVDSILENYEPADPSIPTVKIQEIRTKLLEQPQKRKFDSQFNSVNNVINARLRKVYPVNDGIDLKISGEVKDLAETIEAFEDDNGVKYIKVRTNNETTYNRFRKFGTSSAIE